MIEYNEQNNVKLFTISKSNGATITLSEYGASIISLEVPDKNNKFADVVLGYKNLNDYEDDQFYIGCVVGRFANRIKNGRFTLDGKEYLLTLNSYGNHLHGGKIGYNKVVWKGEVISTEENEAVKFSYISYDGEEGYPGTVIIDVTYTFTDFHELIISYKARSNRNTIINLTQHSYFNLTGVFNKSILDHELSIDADNFIPINKSLLPIGKLSEVNNTVFDFRKSVSINERINADDEQLKNGNGFDHNFVLNNYNSEIRKAASLYEPESGRQMDVYTDQPGIQLYTGNFLDGKMIGKNNIPLNKRCGICLETQHFPDSPNNDAFPSVKLNANEIYKSTTIYKFTVNKNA